MKNLIRFLTKNSFVFLFVFLLFISFVLLVRNNNYQNSKVFNSSNFLIGNLYSIILADLPRAKCFHTICTGYAGILLAKASVIYKCPCFITEHGIYTNERQIEILQADWLKDNKSRSLQVGRDDDDRSVKDLWIDTFTNFSKICYEAADVIITTALIPGRPAPVLIKEETVQSMKPGSVIVDMAVEAGGNCPLSELDQNVVKHGVHLIGVANLPGLVAADSSSLYARNLMNFLNLMLDAESGELKIDREDEIVAGTLVCANGEAVN